MLIYFVVKNTTIVHCVEGLLSFECLPPSVEDFGHITPKKYDPASLYWGILWNATHAACKIALMMGNVFRWEDTAAKIVFKFSPAHETEWDTMQKKAYMYFHYTVGCLTIILDL